MYKIFIKEKGSIHQQTRNFFIRRVYETLETILGLQNISNIYFVANSSPEAIFLLRLALPATSKILLPCGWNNFETGSLNMCWKTPNNSGHFSSCGIAEELLEKYKTFSMVMGHTYPENQEDTLTIKQMNTLVKYYGTTIEDWISKEYIENEMNSSNLIIEI